MKIELSDDTCARIQKLFESDAYRSFEEVITTGLALIEDRDKYGHLEDVLDQDELVDVKEQLRLAEQSGKTIPAAVVFERLEKRYGEMLEQEKLKQQG